MANPPSIMKAVSRGYFQLFFPQQRSLNADLKRVFDLPKAKGRESQLMGQSHP